MLDDLDVRSVAFRMSTYEDAADVDDVVVVIEVEPPTLEPRRDCDMREGTFTPVE